MLTLVLQTLNEGRALDGALRDLDAALGPDDRVVVLDGGSGDDTLRRLEGFAKDRNAALIRLDTGHREAGPLPLPEALHLGAQHSDLPWLMAISANDRLVPEALAEARGWLAGSAADVMVLNSGFWGARPALALPRVDAAQVQQLAQAPGPADLAGLLPDPARMIFARSALPAVSGTAPWDLWDAALSGAKQALFQPKVTLLHKWTAQDPVPVWQGVQGALGAMPRDQIAARLGPLLLVLDQAITRAPPGALPALIPLTGEIARRLPRRLRPTLRAHPGPAGALFDAHHQGGPALARSELALQAAQQQHLLNQALMADYTALSQELDAALPGPQYLRDLYARVRAT